MFFQGKDPVHQTMRRLVKRLEKAGIPHAVVGGMAVYAHGYKRTTDDVDILLTRAGFAEFQKLFVPKQYERAPGHSRRFIDRKNNQSFDILLTGMFPGSGDPGPIAYPNPEAVRETIQRISFVNLPTLVLLKLAAHRWQDFADVVKLIQAHGLDESFAKELHPAVRRDFLECLDECAEERRRQAKYDSREE